MTTPLRITDAADAVTETVYSPPRRGVFLATTGDFEVTLVSGAEVTMTDLAGGVWHDITFTYIAACPANTLVGGQA